MTIRIGVPLFGNGFVLPVRLREPGFNLKIIYYALNTERD